MQRERERGTVKIAQEDPTALRTVCGTQEVLPNIKPEPLPLLSELLKKKKKQSSIVAVKKQFIFPSSFIPRLPFSFIPQRQNLDRCKSESTTDSTVSWKQENEIIKCLAQQALSLLVGAL